MTKKLLNQYSHQIRDREQSEKFFLFKKDGYMESMPYLQEKLNTGSDLKVFNYQLSTNLADTQMKVGHDIGRSLGVGRDELLRAQHNKDLLANMKTNI